MTAITKEEKRWLLYFSIGMIVLTTLPYVLGYTLQGQQWRFSGFFIGVEDGNSYIAKMLTGANGSWLFRTPYTAYPQSGAFTFFPYLLLGKLTASPGQHEQLVALFQLLRCLGIFAMVHATYEFAAFFLQEVKARRFVLVLALLGGGLGFLATFGLKFGGYAGLPLEFYSPETFGFLSALTLPHLAIARALLLWGLLAFLNFKPERSLFWQAGKIGLIWNLLGLFQPLDVVVGWVVLAAGFVIEWTIAMIEARRSEAPVGDQWREKLKFILWAILFSAPIPVYTFIAFNLDPFLRTWTSQNIILSPPPLDYLAGFILVLPFAIAGLVRFAGERKPGSALLLGWLILFPFLAYAPYNLQRRLPEGIWVALCILAALCLFRPGPNAWARWKWVPYTGLVTTVLLLFGGYWTVFHPASPVYLPVSEVDAFNFLAGKPGNEVVLADFNLSNSLPAWANARALIGHGPESIHLAVIQPQVESFLAGSLSEDQAVGLVSQFSVGYVLVSPQDGSGDLPYPFLEPVYKKDGYQIFAVSADKLP